MASVRSKNTKPEITVRSFLHKCGLRYRLHDSKLPGKPDLVFPRYHAALFVHGCFWHGHTIKNCKLARMPKSNIEYWKEKVAYNQRRDKKNLRLLRKLGWKVIVIWECQINNVEKIVDIAMRIKGVSNLSGPGARLKKNLAKKIARH